MGRPSGSTRIWQVSSVTIEPAGNYVKMTAPCGDYRRVSPEAARKIASNLILAAGAVEEWQEAMKQAEVLSRVGIQAEPQQ